MKTKNLYIIAGPNGSGKTTFAKRFLPNYADCTHFVNADLIAQGLSPFSPLALERIKDRVEGGGHGVPATDVRRRFRRSRDNFFKIYEPLLDAWMLFDNSGEKHNLVAQKTDGTLIVRDHDLYKKISKGNGNGK